MTEKRFLSTTEVAKMLGVSRVAIFYRIKKGQIKATKVGKMYLVDPVNIGNILKATLSSRDKQIIDRAVKKTVTEYGEALRLLGSA